MSNAISPAKLHANRENATHSTGPKTEEGKRISSHNALKTGLTGRTVLLPAEDVAAYEAHMETVRRRYQPATDEESTQVHTLAQIEWRLLRIPTLESGILALGRKRFADTHSEESAQNRAVLIEAEVHLAFQKPLANLALQESRLLRQHDRELAKLVTLQSTRRQQAAAQLEEAARLYLSYREAGKDFPLNELGESGFEFSIDQIRLRVAQILAQKDKVAWPTIQARQYFNDLQAA